MELLETIINLLGIVGYIGVVIWWWVTWMGMHNNTINGNTFRLIYPFIVFDKFQFTEKGNVWRKRHLYAWLWGIVLSISIWGYQYFDKAT